jgi:hypothetical protein
MPGEHVALEPARNLVGREKGQNGFALRSAVERYMPSDCDSGRAYGTKPGAT